MGLFTFIYRERHSHNSVVELTSRECICVLVAELTYLITKSEYVDMQLRQVLR